MNTEAAPLPDSAEDYPQAIERQKLCRHLFRHIICAQGWRHLRLLLNSVDRAQTRPPAVFSCTELEFVMWGNDEIDMYKKLLENPQDNPNNIRY